MTEGKLSISSASATRWTGHNEMTIEISELQAHTLPAYVQDELANYEQQIRKYMIEPLKAHHAVLSLNIVPGFVDDARRRIVPTWKQQFTDGFGTKQDYVSAKHGLDEGIREGVFEIESHGWTHMQTDLTSPPGPWWGAPLDGERAEVGWYREFFDVRRNKEIPAAEQKFRMKQSHDWIQAEFGIELDIAAGAIDAEAVGRLQERKICHAGPASGLSGEKSRSAG